MAQLGDLIYQLAGKPDPRQQLLQYLQGGAPAPTPQAGDRTSVAASTDPGTTPPQDPQQPAAYTSPPQLMELYMNLLDRQERNESLNQGIGMVAASLAQDGNRQAILQATGNSGGGSQLDISSLFNNLLAMQQNQIQLQQRAAQRAAVPHIARRYGLDLQTAYHLFDTGELDKVIAEAEKPDNQIVQGADGRHYIVDKRSGMVSPPIGPEKPREIELVNDGAGGLMAVYKDTKEPVGANNIPSVGQPDTGYVWKRNPDGTVAFNEKGQPIQVPKSGGAVEQEQAEAERQAQQRQLQRSIAGNTVSQEVQRATKLIEEGIGTWIPRTGLAGVVGQFVPGTPQWELASALETIASNVSFEKLQQMREASPTGGALGQVSDFENRLLQGVLGSLNIGSQPESLLWRLNRIDGIFKLLDEVLTAGSMEEAEAKAKQLDQAMKTYEQFVADRVNAEEVSIDDLLERYK